MLIIAAVTKLIVEVTSLLSVWTSLPLPTLITPSRDKYLLRKYTYYVISLSKNDRWPYFRCYLSWKTMNRMQSPNLVRISWIKFLYIFLPLFDLFSWNFCHYLQETRYMIVGLSQKVLKIIVEIPRFFLFFY